MSPSGKKKLGQNPSHDSLRMSTRSSKKLAEQLASGEYTPAPLWRVTIPKESGEERVLHVPTVRDRIVERSVHDVIAPFVDPWLGPTSFAFRQGIGVADALQEVVKWRDAGFTHVLRADIEDCFPTIPRHTAVRMLKATLPDRSLDNLIDALVLHRTGNRVAPYPRITVHDGGEPSQTRFLDYHRERPYLH